MTPEDLAVLWVLDEVERASDDPPAARPSGSTDDDIPPAWRGHVVPR